MDSRRGRPLPPIGTAEGKLQQRKLTALKRGVHRIVDTSNFLYGIHLIGVGGAGARVVERLLRDAPDNLLDVPGSRLTALAVDIGDADLGGVRELARRFHPDKSQVETMALELPSRGTLEDTLARYVEFLKLEYPLYHPNPDSATWLPSVPVERDVNGSVPRAVAKAVYGQAYYDGDRPMLKMLKRFAHGVEATGGDSLVCIVFGLGGGTGSGIATDLARHLSNGLFGRRLLVAGIGVGPHPDEIEAQAARLHATLAELDVLCDETKNRGVTLSCGDQYKNPFTAGFIIVPQLPGAGIDVTRELVEREIATLFTQRRGADLWEALRLLNWVAAPATQHPAARTSWGDRWVHLFGFAQDIKPPRDADIRRGLGLRDECVPEVIELRTSATTSDDVAEAWVSALDTSLTPDLPTQRVQRGPDGSVQFLLPRMARRDLAVSAPAREAYGALPKEQRHALHALLLEQGLLLCEPSTRLEGMAGASLGEGNQWIAVPLHDLNGNY